MLSKKFPKFLGLIVVLLPIVVVLLIVVFVIYMLNYSSPNEYYIFQTIDECEQLIPANQTDLMIERYVSPKKDKYLKNLSFESFFGMKFHSSELEYEIFAYEFADSNSALKYYINVTGQNSYEKELPLSDSNENKRLSSSKGMSRYRLIAVYQNKAYLIVAPKQYGDTIDKMLATVFSFQLL